MATFTMPLKRAIELSGGKVTIGPDGISRLEGGNIGLGYPFPIHDETYRPILIGKIVDHYWNREIGHETLDMFQLAMRRKMNEIMPYYVPLYKSTQIEFDPLRTIDIKTLNNAITSSETNANTDSSNTSESNTSSNAGSRTVSSEFPQTQLNNSADYATAAADANSTTQGTSGGTEAGNVQQTASEDATQESDSTTSGYQGVPADILVRYRESLLNIDMMIINELAELFMIVWDNGDTYTATGWSL